MNTFETAQHFLVWGAATIPVRPRDKRPAISSWQPYQHQMPTPAQLLGWFEPTLHNNVGVVTGWAGLTVIDFDDQAKYRRWKRWAFAQGGKTRMLAQSAYQVSTSRGVHVYVRLPEAERNRHMDGIDVKGLGGYVLGEGSIHPTGVVYAALSRSMIIPRVSALSEVLPADLLLAQPDLPAAVANAPVFSRGGCAVSDDPWEAAAHPNRPIGPGLVDKIKTAVALTDFFQATIATSMDGSWLMATCPFHDDVHPSFWINLSKGICGCFAGCTRKPLDVIGLYARLYGLTNHEAIFALGRIVGNA